ncbi:hypothetical protein L9S41_18495 [Geoalkalibacter halelectricus]|uniref:Uncharacterized protein n=1 Tax=Geoalkalibacter halelectricus TaxID=2847045 RepID=A0ABY5ZKE9_9BACT|nr:hypothetical protein [Geoalkalibacter halelectricus]UWZ79647.1 hypothetical protein L9S41_18495 [Geoalkalibacter halelectricus]
MIELDELLYRWQQGHTISQLSRSLGQSRQTVRKYLRMAEKHGLSRDGDQVQRSRVLAAMRVAGVKPQAQSSPSHRRLAPYQEQIRCWLAEPDMTMKQIWRLLRERGVKLSYPSVKRYVHSTVAPATPRVTVRIETPPGQQAQVDFGSARVRFGATVRQLWVFVLTLSFSRHRFVRFVERQDLPSWLDCHVRAGAFALMDEELQFVVTRTSADQTLDEADLLLVEFDQGRRLVTLGDGLQGGVGHGWSPLVKWPKGDADTPGAGDRGLPCAGWREGWCEKLRSERLIGKARPMKNPPTHNAIDGPGVERGGSLPPQVALKRRKNGAQGLSRMQGSLLSRAGRIIGRPDFSLRASHRWVVLGSGSIPETLVLPEGSERGVAWRGVDE